MCSVENLHDEKQKESVNVTDNHFVSDFFCLNPESSRFKIPTELSFQDREFIFHELSSWINNIIEPLSHFQTVSTTNDLIFPGTDEDNRIGMKAFSNQPVKRFRVVPSVHNITI